MRRNRKRTKRNGKMIYLDAHEWVCANNHFKGVRFCKYRNYVNEDVLFQYAKDIIGKYRQNTDSLHQDLSKYLSTHFSDNNVEERVQQIESDISNLKQQRQNRLSLFDKGIINDIELKEYIETEYRPKEKQLFDAKLKYTNIHKEVEKIRRQYKDFVKQLQSIDLENLKKCDIKKVFAGIYVGTYNVPQEKFVYHELDLERDKLEERPYTWINNNNTFKQISSHVGKPFMNK